MQMDYITYMQNHPHTVSIENSNGVIIWRKITVSGSTSTIDYEVDIANNIARSICLKFGNNARTIKC